MGIGCFNCVICNGIDHNNGHHGECQEGHRICNNCNKNYKHDENYWIIDCPACKRENSPPEATYTEGEIREVLNKYEDFNLSEHVINIIINKLKDNKNKELI